LEVIGPEPLVGDAVKGNGEGVGVGVGYVHRVKPTIEVDVRLELLPYATDVSASHGNDVTRADYSNLVAFDVYVHWSVVAV
jgi:hypothetical protein